MQELQILRVTACIYNVICTALPNIYCSSYNIILTLYNIILTLYILTLYNILLTLYILTLEFTIQFTIDLTKAYLIKLTCNQLHVVCAGLGLCDIIPFNNLIRMCNNNNNHIP